MLAGLACAWLALAAGCGRIGLKPNTLDGGNDADVSWESDDSAVITEPPDADASDSDGCLDDSDDDGVCDARDNCPERPNAGQEDLDGDAQGDACDSDRDGDGVPDERDACPLDAPDDRDGDGVCDGVDRCLRGDDLRDEDGDGQPDACDPCPVSARDDVDLDGVCDDVDACAGGDDRVDSDGDGTADGCDACPLEPTKLVSDVCDCAPAPRPLAAWRFDESSGASAKDSVGTHHGTLLDMSAASWRAGQRGNALSFDGVDDRVHVGPLGSGLRSVAFWLRAASLGVTRGETPWLSPSANGDKDFQWFEPENAYRSDDEYTNAGLGLIDFNAHDWSGFHVVIPPGASVPGILAQVEFNNSNPTCTFGIELSWNAGAANAYTSTDYSSLPLVQNEYLSFGAADDAWGHTWNGAQLSDAAFRLRLTKGGIPGSPMTPGVDHIRVKVFYAMAVGASRNLLLLGDGTRVGITPQGVSLPGWPPGTQLYIDGVSRSTLDASWHHVVVTSPTDLATPDLQIGGSLDAAGFFEGELDELRAFADTLSSEQARALSLHTDCGR